MSEYHRAIDEINNLISVSCGAKISLPCGEEYKFEVGQRYSLAELAEFESKTNVVLPDEYKCFLNEVGASKLYVDKFGAGIAFLRLEELKDFSNEVFLDMNNPFPMLIIIASNIGRGDFIGYGISEGRQGYQLGTFSHEEDPERWLQDASHWSSLKEWLVALVESEGEEDLI